MIKFLKKFKFCSVRESMSYDVLIMGGGPAGLSGNYYKIASIRLA